MSHPSRACFETLSDEELHAAVRRLTARSNVTLADLLVHLGEIEARGIHRERACASLYTYCIYDLRMSEDAAFRRSKAARLVHQHPELRDIVARGELHLTGLLLIGPLLGGERHREVLERARFRSKREIARLIAEFDPKPGVPPRIEPLGPAVGPRARTLAEALAGPVRSLPEGDQPEDWIAPADVPVADGMEAIASREDVASHDLAEAERALEGAAERRAEARPSPAPPLCYSVQFTANQEYIDLLEEAFDLLGCARRAADLPDVQLRALRELVERLREQKQGAPPSHRGEAQSAGSASEPRLVAPARVDVARAINAPARVEESPAVTTVNAPARVEVGTKPRSPHGRYVPVVVRREVWTRDRARCAYVDERGQRCCETGGLELHHRHAYARGGPATAANLELRCRAHNLLAAEQDFGRGRMDIMRGVEGAAYRRGR